MLSLCGWRWDGTAWYIGDQRIDEEKLDALDDEAWQRFISPWLSSATVSAN